MNFHNKPNKKLKQGYTNLKKNESEKNEQLRQQEQELKNFLFQEVERIFNKYNIKTKKLIPSMSGKKLSRFSLE